MHATLADALADAVWNSVEAGARRVSVALVEEGEMVSATVADDGNGMDAVTRARAFDPRCTEIRKHVRRPVGLGLPFLKRFCETFGGGCALTSEPGVGTTLQFHVRAAPPDAAPMGDLAGTLAALLGCPGDFELVFTHRRGGDSYSVVRSELAEAVGGLETAGGLSLALAFLRGQEDLIGSGSASAWTRRVS